MLLLLLPHTAVTTESLASGYTDTGTLVQGADSSSAEDKPSGVTAEPLSGLDETSREITISDDEFYQWISEIYSNLDKYEGYTVSVTGYVLKGTDYLGENEFVAARLAMTCCTADLTPVGMVCKYDGVEGLEASAWVTVRGVIAIGQYQGEDEPQILVTDITPADVVEGYIYPH
jgi:putative membrane protein